MFEFFSKKKKSTLALDLKKIKSLLKIGIFIGSQKMFMLYNHEQLYIHICRCIQNHNNDTIKTSDTVLLKIYLYLYLKGFERVTKGFTVWEVNWKLNRTATYWPPTLMAITPFLSRSPGPLNRGPGSPASLGHVPHSSIFSPTATAQPGALGPPLLGAGFLYSNFLQLIELPVHRVI